MVVCDCECFMLSRGFWLHVHVFMNDLTSVSEGFSYEMICVCARVIVCVCVSMCLGMCVHMHRCL